MPITGATLTGHSPAYTSSLAYFSSNMSLVVTEMSRIPGIPVFMCTSPAIGTDPDFFIVDTYLTDTEKTNCLITWSIPSIHLYK